MEHSSIARRIRRLFHWQLARGYEPSKLPAPPTALTESTEKDR